MSQWQSRKYLILLQAFSFVLPSLTNDFIALLKDSSLVLLITLVELTIVYTLTATNSLNFFEIGAFIAVIYFMLGPPFVCLAKLVERCLKLEKQTYFYRRIDGR
jgi:polar amino acid transport system substrate-binding protein